MPALSVIQYEESIMEFFGFLYLKSYVRILRQERPGFVSKI